MAAKTKVEQPRPKAGTSPALPNGQACTNCGAHVPYYVGICEAKAEITNAAGTYTIERKLCGHCSALWNAAEELFSWCDNIAWQMVDFTSASNADLDGTCVIPQDRSVSATSKRLRLLLDTSFACRQAFLAMGARS